MATASELHNKAQELWNELNDAYNGCYEEMGAMREEVVEASPYYEEYTNAQDALIESQKNHDTTAILAILHQRFMQANDKAVRTSPLYEDYKKVCDTHKRLLQALDLVGDAVTTIGELENIGKHWVSSTNSEQ